MTLSKIYQNKFGQVGVIMCDVKKYTEIYEEISKLNSEDTLQLVLESESEEVKEFYEMVED